jgi:hypothetical protein
MPVLWQPDSDGHWNPSELNNAAVLRDGALECVNQGHINTCHGEVLLVPGASNTRSSQWLLLAPPDAGVRINDLPHETGIRALADRDAVRVADFPTMYFSTERLAMVEPFPSEENIFCARCKSLLVAGDTAVCCPQCSIWFHEQDGKGCWTYASNCSLCDQPTDLESAGFRWTPGAL